MRKPFKIKNLFGVLTQKGLDNHANSIQQAISESQRSRLQESKTPTGVKFNCPRCACSIEIMREHAGKSRDCPNCGRLIQMPTV